MSQRWRALQHVMVSPTTIGDIAKSVLVLVQFEHKMISGKSLRKPQSITGRRPAPARPLRAWSICPQHARSAQTA
jgi:hypothetical protein